MLIYGTGSKTLGSKKLQAERCPECDSNDIHITCVAKYFHIFWIPFFPTDRRIFPECHSCNQQLTITDQKTLDKMKMEKKNFKYPFYLFSAAILIVLLIAYLTYDSIQHDKEVAQNLKELQVSDVIVLKSTLSPKQEYYYCRVIEIRPDTIIYNVSNYSYQDGVPDESSYRRDKGEYLDFFNIKDSLYFTQKEIDSLYKVDEIYDLYRLEK
jgi:hypothetical protein